MSATRPPRRTREQRRAETRRRLLDAGAQVFTARGLEGASIDEITERAGYTRGAFYSNFSSKEELLVELCDQRLEEYADVIVPVIRDTPREGRAAEVARLLTERGLEPEAMLLVELARLRSSNEEVARLLDGFFGRFTALVEELLRSTAGELGHPSDEQIEAAARGMVGAVIGLAFLSTLGIGDDETTAQLLLGGVSLAAFPDAPVPATPTSAR